MTGASIFSIVIGKLNHWQQPCSIILFFIDKCSKVRFYYAILSLSLAIYLGVEGYR